MSNQRSQTTRWFYGLPLLHGIVYRVSTLILAVVGFVWWRAKYTGRECIPKTGPFLLLPNHSSMLDPFWIGAPTGRGMKSMASAGLFQIPIVGAYLSMVGCFPKKKFTKDKTDPKVAAGNKAAKEMGLLKKEHLELFSAEEIEALGLAAE